VTTNEDLGALLRRTVLQGQEADSSALSLEVQLATCGDFGAKRLPVTETASWMSGSLMASRA